MDRRRNGRQAPRSARPEGSTERTARAGRPDQGPPARGEIPATALSQPGPRSGTPPRPTAIRRQPADPRCRLSARCRPESHAPACLPGGARHHPGSRRARLAPAPRPPAPRPIGSGPRARAVAHAGPLVRAARRKHPNRAPDLQAGRGGAGRYIRVTRRVRVARRVWLAGNARPAESFRPAGRFQPAARGAGGNRVGPRPRAAHRRSAPTTADVVTVAPADRPAGRCPHHPDSPCGERIVPVGEATAGPVDLNQPRPKGVQGVSRDTP